MILMMSIGVSTQNLAPMNATAMKLSLISSSLTKKFSNEKIERVIIIVNIEKIGMVKYNEMVQFKLLKQYNKQIQKCISARSKVFVINEMKIEKIIQM